MRCRKARELISLYVGPDESWLNPGDRRALEAHIAICEPCRQECRESRAAIGLLRQCWQLSKDTAALLEKEQTQVRHGPHARTTVLRGVSHRVAAWAMAACLTLAVLGGWGLSHQGRAQPALDRAPALAGESLPPTIELADGRRMVPGMILQTSYQETQRVVLNGRHRVVMNGGTRLFIESVVKAGRPGCLVRLALGEVGIHVEHDGNPFIVQTAHGRAVITGTTFDVKVTEAGTVLVVAEGGVRFESAGGAVQVPAGQQSVIADGTRPPATPTPCDARTLTAWADLGDRGRPARQGMAAGNSAAGNLAPMLIPPARIQLDLDRIDYGRWVEQNRRWFQRQFPWIFDLRCVLSQQGADVDYPELLVRTGDIWRFRYVDEQPELFSRLDPNSLLATGRDYGLDPQRLLQHVSALRDTQGRSAPPATGPTGVGGLLQWLNESAAAADGRLPESLHSYHAARYFVQTRTLIWLAMRDGRWVVPQQQRAQVLDLLRKIITAAYEWQYVDLCSPETAKPLGCDGPESSRAQIKAELASTICTCERMLAEYVRTAFPAPRRHELGD